MIPVIIAKYLSLPSVDFTLEDKIAYLIKSQSGDSYYLLGELPERGVITEGLAELVCEEIQCGDWSYKDILKWYKVWDSE